MMFPFVAKSLPTQHTKSNESLAAMTKKIDESNTNTMGDNDESESIRRTSIIPVHSEFKHYQHDEPNPQDNSICED